jgi:hypothetical protein
MYNFAEEPGMALARSSAATLDFSNMKDFLTRPTSKSAGVVQCYIKRNKGGTNKMFPEYCLYMKEGDRFLLCSKKRPNNKTSNYLVSMQRGDLDRNSESYLGKLRANFIGTGESSKENCQTPS